jgi:hypothetical protein
MFFTGELGNIPTSVHSLPTNEQNEVRQQFSGQQIEAGRKLLSGLSDREISDIQDILGDFLFSNEFNSENIIFNVAQTPDEKTLFQHMIDLCLVLDPDENYFNIRLAPDPEDVQITLKNGHDSQTAEMKKSLENLFNLMKIKADTSQRMMNRKIRTLLTTSAS